MAIIESKFFSKELFRSVCVNVILPLPDSGDNFFGSKTYLPHDGQKYQVLYLLHGFSADHSDWSRFSGIERYAQAKQLAVVMPGVDNSFYSNLPGGGNYYNYYTKELPTVMQRIFPISGKRENNFIAGLSMGGFGAYKAALLNPEQYIAAASLSGGMDIVGNYKKGSEDLSNSKFPDIPIAHWLEGVYGSDLMYFNPETDDLRVLLMKALKSEKSIPKLYQCCGTEDMIYESNISFRDYARNLGADLTYEEGPGIHDWDFWDPYIRRVLDWLPVTGKFVD